MPSRWPESRAEAAGSSVARSAGLATAATFAGYATTLLQQVVLARSLGVSANVDALAVALAWAVAVSGIVGWTLATAVVPLYIAARVSARSDASELFGTATSLAGVAGAALTLMTLLAAEPLASALLPGGSPDTRQTLVLLLRITCPLPFIWVMWIMASGLANARRQYVGAALVTVVPSLIVIATLLLSPTVQAAAGAYVVGMTAQVGVLVASGRQWRRDLAPRFAREAFSTLAPRLLPLAAMFVFQSAALLAVRAVASLGDPGDLAALDYAMRLTMAVESVLLTGAVAVALTVWAEERVTGVERLPARHAILLTGSVGALVAALLMLGATPTVTVLFGGGAFTGADVSRVAVALTWVAPGMAARMLILLVLRLLLARGSTWALAALFGLALAAVTIAALLGHIAAGLAGVAFGYSVGWVLAAIAAVVPIRRTTLRHSGADALNSRMALEQ